MKKIKERRIGIVLLTMGISLQLWGCTGSSNTLSQVGSAIAESGTTQNKGNANPSDGDATTDNNVAIQEGDIPKSGTIENAPQPQEIPYEITLGFAGDMNFADNYQPVEHYVAIGADEITDVISPETVQAMQNVSLMWINNEFVYANGGAPLNGKKWTFRADPMHVSWLTDLGVDIVGLANNHVYDYGPEAFEQTLQTLEAAGIPYTGAGHNLEQACTPIYLETDGFTIAYVAASRAEKYKMTPQATDTEGGILRCYDNALFLEAIREADQHADYVIALPHWGTEYSTELEQVQIDGAKEYIDAGADAVIGAHPHILQAVDYVEDKPVVYSLGNFWFNNKDQNTMLAVLHITGSYLDTEEPNLEHAAVSLQLLPGTQRNCETFLATQADEKRRIWDDIEDISTGITIDGDGYVLAE